VISCIPSLKTAAHAALDPERQPEHDGNGREAAANDRPTKLTDDCPSASTLAEIGAALSSIGLAVYQKGGDNIHVNSERDRVGGEHCVASDVASDRVVRASAPQPISGRRGSDGSLLTRFSPC
jgi:hypothetical protein